ncbi:hypothetical protein R3X25_15030 [Lutibacter sp. TH_r2]|uniref:hypothetical protein n=1 Tax=Lutibacter sp. TH_r2 TaxID=3082083 RepID=UPI0029539E66|nr:hypothetical protein [Lutibacter sp. TH_r2]MDV7188599.1 hypothetical protein [Lutibacter sp. TH_r2]
MEFIDNPYFSKIALTALGILIKIVIDGIIKPDNDFKGLAKLFLIFIYFILPILIVIWLNIDDSISNSKLTSTLIILNVGVLIFNYFQDRFINQSKLIVEKAKLDKEIVGKVNDLNNLQAEKMSSIANNQNYILNELSKINDRIIKFLIDKKK